MRNFTPETETQLLKDFGTEPMIVVAVDWVQNGNVTFYTDRAITGQPVEGRILDISILDNVFILENNSDSKEISMTLDDSDGILKDIINNNDIHGRPVSIFHWDASTPIDNRALLFKGVINSPIIWDEGDRTLKLTVLNKIEDAEYGFSLDESLGIPNQPLNLQGKAWPLCFGTVVNVPALRLTDQVEGTLETSVGIRDFALVPKYNYLIGCTKCLKCRHGSIFDPSTLVSTELLKACSNCQRRVCVNLRKLELQIVKQTGLQLTNLIISGAFRFPQGQVITLKIDGAFFIGFFNGTSAVPSSTFIITRREHAKFAEIGRVSATSVAKTINDEINNLIDSACGTSIRDLIAIDDICDGKGIGDFRDEQKQKDVVDDFWRVFNAWPNPGFQFIDAGATVQLSTASDIAYVCNLVSSTSIIRVKAKKKIGQVTKLIDIPNSFWSTRTADFGTYNTTEIVFPKLLSTIDKSWEDNIFVTLESSIGPDIVEILEWLIDTYTSFTINASSFASVKLDLVGWKANFALLDRGNILDLLRDIAFQARCAIYIKNDEIFLQFLAKRPEIDDLILESDVENNSLSLGHTTTEDLVTKFVANWTADYAETDKIKTILRWNVGRYGLKEREFDFFIYSDERLVRTVSTFWLLRKSQIWRRVRFTTPIHKLQLETFDNIEVRFTDFSTSDILAQIEKASYNSADYSINFDCWTPVRSGEQTEFNFAFPHGVDVETIFPNIEDVDSGRFDISAPGALTLAPLVNHPLFKENDSCTPPSNQTFSQIIARDLASSGCYTSRFNLPSKETKEDQEDQESEKATQDTPTAEAPIKCEYGQDVSIKPFDPTTGETVEAGPGVDGGDLVDSNGNVLTQTLTTTRRTALTFPENEECPPPFPEDDGDPNDALGKEDPDNDPAIDGCDTPECPTPDPCDAEPIDSPCAATVNIIVVFYGLKIVGQVIATKFHVDQYCFNSDSMAEAFAVKMITIRDAQPKPQLGDTQIEIGSFTPALRQPCGDSPNTRPDAALINFRQFPTGPFGPFPPNCTQEADEIPVTDPCVPPDYL